MESRRSNKEEEGANAQIYKMDGQRKKRRSLNLAEKLLVIEEYEKNRNSREIAKLFGCSCQTIQNILRHKNEYLEDWANNADPRRVRYRPNSRLRALQYILYEWVRRCRYYPMRITDQLIRKTGQEVAFIIGVPEIDQSVGWVTRFKEKFKLNNYDLMNPERFDAMNSTKDDKKSLDVHSIITEMREEYGSAIVPDKIKVNLNLPPPQEEEEVRVKEEYISIPDFSLIAEANSYKVVDQTFQDYTVLANKRLKRSSSELTYPSPSASYDNSEENIIETIDLTESIHSESELEDDGEVVMAIQVQNGPPTVKATK